MINKRQILDKLHTDIDLIEDKINNADNHNVKNAIIRKFIKTGIAIDYAMPYILAGFIMFYAGRHVGRTPFLIDTFEENEQIEVLDTSNGIHNVRIVDFDNPISHIEHSTPWKLNEYGLYERSLTNYMLYNEGNILDENTVLKMSKEEMDSMFIITDTEIITKPILDEDDEIYNEEVIIVKNYVSVPDTKIVDESFEFNFLTTCLYLIMIFFLGNGIKSFKKVVFQDYIKDKLETLSVHYRVIDEKEIRRLEKVLAIKKENLSLIEGYQKRK